MSPGTANPGWLQQRKESKAFTTKNTKNTKDRKKNLKDAKEAD